jgi:hypothetical protein
MMAVGWIIFAATDSHRLAPMENDFARTWFHFAFPAVRAKMDFELCPAWISDVVWLECFSERKTVCPQNPYPNRRQLTV